MKAAIVSKLQLSVGHPQPRAPGRRGAALVQAKAGKERIENITGIVFKPFDEVQVQLREQEQRGDLNDPRHSFVRMHYASEAEAAINEQINVEYNMSYIYHSMSTYFNRDNVSLPGFGRYFGEQSLEERGHAQKLIDFQNTRGGRVKLEGIMPPEAEYNDIEKGDALFAMELSLSLERLNYEKLLHLWAVMEKHADAQAVHFVEYMLEDQAAEVKQTADYVAQLRRVGKGLGVWQFDQELYEGEVNHMAYAGPDSNGA